MIIRTVRHQGLRLLLEDDNSRFVKPELLPRVRKILTTRILAEDIDRFASDVPQGWRLHRLSRGRQGAWSVSVSGNWRIMFMDADGYVDRLNLEDYH